MPITIKNGDVVPYMKALGLLSDPAKYDLPMEGAVKVRDLFRELNTRKTTIDEVQKQLFDKYATKDEATGQVKFAPLPGTDQVQIDVPPENQVEFNQKYQELMDVEVQISTFITKSDLPARVSSGILIGLGELFVSEAGPKAA